VVASQSLALRMRSPTDPVLQALRTGEKVLVARITDEMLVAGARDAEHLEVIRSLGLSSFILLAGSDRGSGWLQHAGRR
jgi:hypothetical protein